MYDHLDYKINSGMIYNNWNMRMRTINLEAGEWLITLMALTLSGTGGPDERLLVFTRMD